MIFIFRDPLCSLVFTFDTKKEKCLNVAGHIIRSYLGSRNTKTLFCICEEGCIKDIDFNNGDVTELASMRDHDEVLLFT